MEIVDLKKSDPETHNFQFAWFRFYAAILFFLVIIFPWIFHLGIVEKPEKDAIFWLAFPAVVYIGTFLMCFRKIFISFDDFSKEPLSREMRAVNSFVMIWGTSMIIKFLLYVALKIFADIFPEDFILTLLVGLCYFFELILGVMIMFMFSEWRA